MAWSNIPINIIIMFCQMICLSHLLIYYYLFREIWLTNTHTPVPSKVRHACASILKWTTNTLGWHNVTGRLVASPMFVITFWQAAVTVFVVGRRTGRLPPEFWPVHTQTGKELPRWTQVSQTYLGAPQELCHNLVTSLDKTVHEVRTEKIVWYNGMWISLMHAGWVAMLHSKFYCIIDNARVYAHAKK